MLRKKNVEREFGQCFNWGSITCWETRVLIIKLWGGRKQSVMGGPRCWSGYIAVPGSSTLPVGYDTAEKGKGKKYTSWYFHFPIFISHFRRWKEKKEYESRWEWDARQNRFVKLEVRRGLIKSSQQASFHVLVSSGTMFLFREDTGVTESVTDTAQCRNPQEWIGRRQSIRTRKAGSGELVLIFKENKSLLDILAVANLGTISNWGRRAACRLSSQC